MGRIIYSKPFPFRMLDWAFKNIQKVYAGTNCIMALTSEGKVFQKITDPEVAIRPEYWKNIKEIAVSKWMTGLVMGLVNDGTCMIGKKALRKYYGSKNYLFDRVNNEVKSWKNIVEIGVSDALFALDKDGKVHYVPLDPREDDYREVAAWENVAHIVTGLQNSVFGITKDGRVLCAGHGCRNGAHGDLRKKLQWVQDAVDICTSGTECGRVLIAHRDGRISDEENRSYDFSCDTKGKVLDGNLWGTLIRTEDGAVESDYYGAYDTDFMKKVSGRRVSSFAGGDVEYREGFVIAVAE